MKYVSGLAVGLFSVAKNRAYNADIAADCDTYAKKIARLTVWRS